ncbi:MAG: AgmX/PglI C-terminal domain-containing protein [Myxococcota bacterium]
MYISSDILSALPVELQKDDIEHTLHLTGGSGSLAEVALIRHSGHVLLLGRASFLEPFALLTPPEPPRLERKSQSVVLIVVDLSGDRHSFHVPPLNLDEAKATVGAENSNIDDLNPPPFGGPDATTPPSPPHHRATTPTGPPPMAPAPGGFSTDDYGAKPPPPSTTASNNDGAKQGLTIIVAVIVVLGMLLLCLVFSLAALGFLIAIPQDAPESSYEITPVKESESVAQEAEPSPVPSPPKPVEEDEDSITRVAEVLEESPHVTERDSSTGSLDKKVIQRVVRKNLRGVKSCYERELRKNPSLEGRVEVTFAVLPTGRVADVRIIRNTVNDKVGQCITTKVGRWVFPKPEGDGRVSLVYPFVFKAPSSTIAP